MATYDALVAAGTTTRAAAALTGICRATAVRRRARPTPLMREPVVPGNRLTGAERYRTSWRRGVRGRGALYATRSFPRSWPG